jgi:hypothetical protein
MSLNKYFTKYNLLENIDTYNIDDIDNKLKELLINNKNNLKNKNYLCFDNIENYLNNGNKSINESINNIINYNIKINIPKKNGKRALTLAEWGYPAFGGGENWLLTFNQILHINGYETYFICFSDPFKNEYFNKINLIDLGYVKIIQMPKHILEIIQIIKIIDPDFIHHQGINRISFMKLSNVLEIPFLTGFCFWNDIIKFNLPNININMLSNERLEKTDVFEYIIKNSYTYVSSEFVNDIIYKLYNIKLDVIDTISSKEDFYIENNFANDDEYSKKIYVTIINCHYHKGGFLIKYLCETLDFNIPLQLVYTENDPNISIDYVRELIKKRNLVKNINIVISEKVNIKIIYNKTRILLTPSICEETFCRVAYEGMMNKIPIISTSNGNLKYLLNEYAIFINELNIHEWKITIENIYNDHKLI